MEDKHVAVKSGRRGERVVGLEEMDSRLCLLNDRSEIETFLRMPEQNLVVNLHTLHHVNDVRVENRTIKCLQFGKLSSVEYMSHDSKIHIGIQGFAQE